MTCWTIQSEYLGTYELNITWLGLLLLCMIFYQCSYSDFFPKLLRRSIIWRLQVQSGLQASNNTGILNTCTRLWLTESEQATPVDSIKDVVRSSVKVPEFDKHLKKAGGHIGRNVVEITIKIKTMVRKTLMIKIGFKCLIFTTFHIFLSYCQIHHNLSVQHVCMEMLDYFLNP